MGKMNQPIVKEEMLQEMLLIDQLLLSNLREAKKLTCCVFSIDG